MLSEISKLPKEHKGTSILMLPQEIIDRIFLELGPDGFEILEITRELQSPYVKELTKFKYCDNASEINREWIHKRDSFGRRLNCFGCFGKFVFQSSPANNLYSFMGGNTLVYKR